MRQLGSSTDHEDRDLTELLAVGRAAGVEAWEDWYGVSVGWFAEHGGAGLLRRLGKSPVRIVTMLLPQHPWQRWRFRNPPKGLWRDPATRSAALADIAEHFGFVSLESWYALRQWHFRARKLAGLLGWYGGSPLRAVCELFPQSEVLEWRMGSVPDGFWREQANRRRYLDWLASIRGWHRPEDWYALTTRLFIENDGSGILAHYGDRPIIALQERWPEQVISPWRLGRTPEGYWDKWEHRRAYFDWLGAELAITTHEGWYDVTQDVIEAHHGGGLLTHRFAGSPCAALVDAYPEHRWLPWRFRCVPQGYWESSVNRRAFAEWLGVELGLSTPSDWYHLTASRARAAGWGGLHGRYAGSVREFVRDVFPEQEWLEWLFAGGVAPGFWSTPHHRSAYMGWLGALLGFSCPADWYDVTKELFAVNFGGGLLAYHRNSPRAAVQDFMPGERWLPWRFRRSPVAFWHERENRVAFMRNLGVTLDIATHDEWYRVGTREVAAAGGAGLLKLFDTSLIAILRDVFPEQEWLPWSFERAPYGFWEQKASGVAFFLWCQERLGISAPDDWYGMPKDVVVGLGGGGLLDRYGGSLGLALQDAFPETAWELASFDKASKRQRIIYDAIRDRFPELEVCWNYRHSELRFEGSGLPMELDIFLPQLLVAIEYQGEQHYHPIEAWGGLAALQRTQRRDIEKCTACAAAGIRLIAIAYDRWDGTPGSLWPLLAPLDQFSSASVISRAAVR